MTEGQRSCSKGLRHRRTRVGRLTELALTGALGLLAFAGCGGGEPSEAAPRPPRHLSPRAEQEGAERLIARAQSERPGARREVKRVTCERERNGGPPPRGSRAYQCKLLYGDERLICYVEKAAGLEILRQTACLAPDRFYGPATP